MNCALVDDNVQSHRVRAIIGAEFLALITRGGASGVATPYHFQKRKRKRGEKEKKSRKRKEKIKKLIPNDHYANGSKWIKSDKFLRGVTPSLPFFSFLEVCTLTNATVSVNTPACPPMKILWRHPCSSLHQSSVYSCRNI